MDPFPVDEFELNFYVDPATGNSHFCRDFMAGKNFSTITPCCSQIVTECAIFDRVNKSFTCNYKHAIIESSFVKTLTINVNYQYWDMNLAQGQNMDFEGFSNLHLMVQPEYFTNIRGLPSFANQGKN